MWFLLPSDGIFRSSSTSLQYYLTRQGRRVVLRGDDVTGHPLDCRLNWIPDPAPTTPRDHGKENHHQHHLPGDNGNTPGTDLRSKERMRTSVKHPQPPWHPQHPSPAGYDNSSRDNLLDQADHGRLYKRAPPSRVKESTERSYQDYFSGSSLTFSSKQLHRDNFSGLPYRATNKNTFMTDPTQKAISLSQSDCRTEIDASQTPPRAALPDSVIEVGLKPPETTSTSRIPHEDWPPVITEIPSITPEPKEELSESRQCPNTPGKWFQPSSRGSKRPMSKSTPSPRCPKKHFSSLGRWFE